MSIMKLETQPPLWEQLVHLPVRISTFLGPKSDERIDIKQYFDEQQKALIMRYTPGDLVEGPPGHCHGGFTATILDECMGASVWWNGLTVLAAELRVKYRRPVPLGAEYFSRSLIQRQGSRRVFVEGQVCDMDGNLYATAEGLFIKISMKKLNVSSEHFEEMQSLMALINSGAKVSEIVAREDFRDRAALFS